MNTYAVYINGIYAGLSYGKDEKDAFSRYIDRPYHRLLISDKIEFVEVK